MTKILRVTALALALAACGGDDGATTTTADGDATGDDPTNGAAGGSDAEGGTDADAPGDDGTVTDDAPSDGDGGDDDAVESPASGDDGGDDAVESPASGDGGDDDAVESPASGDGGDDDAVESPASGDGEAAGDEALPAALAEQLARLFGAAGGWGLLEHPRPAVRSDFEVIEASPLEQLYRCGDSGTYRTRIDRGGDFVQSSDELRACTIGESVYTGSFGSYESSGRGSGAGRSLLTTEESSDFVIEDPARDVSWRGASASRSITRAEDGSLESLSVRINGLELVREGTVERSVSEVRVSIEPASAGDGAGSTAAAGEPLYLSVLLREVRTGLGDAPITLESVTELPVEGNALHPTAGQIVVTGGVNWTLQPNAQGQWQLQVGDGDGADYVLPMEEPYRFHELSR